jgi:hypothetical protein
MSRMARAALAALPASATVPTAALASRLPDHPAHD